MAKSGKHLAPKKESRLELMLREHLRKATSIAPQTDAEQESEASEAEEKPKKFSLSMINAESIKAFLKRQLNPREKKKKKMRQKKLSPSQNMVKAAKLAAMLLFCFLMITPLRSCVFKNDGYVSEREAQKTAVADSGVKSKAVENMRTDMIKLDGEACYKIEFTSDVNGYRYIVNAETGEIVAQGFYSVIKNDKENENG